MAATNSPRTKAARNIVEKFPHTDQAKLARMIYKLNPLIFKDESVRLYPYFCAVKLRL